MKTATHQKMKASILGVGTELTTGQITNKNGSWISEKLIPFGVETQMHLVVPDDRDLIKEALEMCAKTSDLIFITGGLGPTSDDFTRELVSEWAQKPLVFDEASWGHVQVRLTSRGFEVKDFQKQQCYFPESSKVLTNNNGTANGFQLEVLTAHFGKKMVFVLPGPPREIETIWKDFITKWLFVETQNVDRKITKSWDTLGRGESDVATLVEAELKKHLPEKVIYDLGYRVHLPYVEVKFSYYKSQEPLIQNALTYLEKQLAPITVLRNFEDITAKIIEMISTTDFAFYDFVTQGFLHHRLAPQLKKAKNWMWKQASVPMDSDFFSEEKNFMALLPLDTSYEKMVLLFEFQGQAQSLELEAPMKSALMAERRQQYFAELALLQFVKHFKPLH